MDERGIERYSKGPIDLLFLWAGPGLYPCPEAPSKLGMMWTVCLPVISCVMLVSVYFWLDGI
jgi:hypothetical protein